VDLQGEENLMKAVAAQPVSVGICAGPTLMFYAGGVIDKVGECMVHEKGANQLGLS